MKFHQNRRNRLGVIASQTERQTNVKLKRTPYFVRKKKFMKYQHPKSVAFEGNLEPTEG